MHTLFIVGKYPTHSEEFIYRDMKFLKNQGMNVSIFSLRYTGKTPHLKFNRIESALSLKAHLECLWKNKVAYFKAFKMIFSQGSLHPKELFIRLKKFLEVPSLIQLCQQLGIKHIHAHFAYLTADIAKMLSVLTNIPYSVSTHGWDIFVQKKYVASRVDLARHIITCTDYYDERMCELLNEKKLAVPVYKINHGISLKEYSYHYIEKAQVTYQLLTVGRLVPKKGFLILLKACWMLKNQGFPFRLTICGEGPLQFQLIERAKKFEILDSINLTGWLTPDKLKNQMRDSHIGIQPSIIVENGDRDGIPNVLVEALALGLPCVATSISAIPELIKHRETGLLVEEKNPEMLAESIVELCQNSKLRKNISESGRRQVEKYFNAEVNSKKMIELLK